MLQLVFCTANGVGHLRGVVKFTKHGCPSTQILVNTGLSHARSSGQGKREFVGGSRFSMVKVRSAAGPSACTRTVKSKIAPLAGRLQLAATRVTPSTKGSPIPSSSWLGTGDVCQEAGIPAKRNSAPA